MEADNRSVVNSLSGSDKRIIEYLPYLLQDLWELGGGNGKLIELLERNLIGSIEQKEVLDLCCGKGAFILSMAEKFRCFGKGIDLFAPFIKEANEYANGKKINQLVEFETMDIRDAVKLLRDYSIVRFGGDTDVLGSEKESIIKVLKCCSLDGYLLYESAVKSLDEVYQTVQETGLQLVDQMIMAREEIQEINRDNNKKINQRARELIEKYPANSKIFKKYLREQKRESFELENNLIWFAFLLKRA